MNVHEWPLFFYKAIYFYMPLGLYMPLDFYIPVWFLYSTKKDSLSCNRIRRGKNNKPPIGTLYIYDVSEENHTR